MASLGSTPGLIVAAGVGAAASVALEPAFEVPKQDAWARLPNRILDLGTLARLVAQGGVVLGNPDGKTAGSAYGEALRRGYSSDKLDRLVWLELRAPDLSRALELWRRGLLGPPTSKAALALVDHALAKEQIEPAYWDAIKDLFGSRLDPAQLAVMVQRSIVPNVRDPASGELLLPNQPTVADSDVPLMPQVDLDPLIEARAHGIDFARLAAEARIIGLPASPDLAARMVYRKIINRDAFNAAILAGNTRGEWAPFLFEAFREIPSVADYVQLHLRGHTDLDGMHEGAARHGMAKEDVNRVYLARGRPAAPGQMATAAARGIDGPLKKPMDREQFLLGIAESDIRPEWGPMLWDARFLYPPLFQLSRLVQAGAITADVAAEWARKDRYPPEVVDALHAYWTQSSAGTKADSRVTLATSQAIAALKRRFILELTDEQGVTNGLQGIGISAGSADQILNLWTFERLWTVKVLTPAQIKKEYTGGTLTLDDAIAQLVQQHYSVDDATRFLQS